MPKAKTPNIYAKRRADTDRKLRAALERPIKGLPTHPELKPDGHCVTIPTLAKEARVARRAPAATGTPVIDLGQTSCPSSAPSSHK